MKPWFPVLLLLLGGPVAAADLSHEAALVALGYPEETARVSAADRLGDIGTDEDVSYLLSSLRDEKENVRNMAEQAIWRIWSRSGHIGIDAMFTRGLREMHEGNLKRAISTFSEIVRLKPEFTEAWNKRAQLYFMVRQYDKSRLDCEEVLKRNPNHFGALTGVGQVYLEQEQLEKALEYFQRAVNVNPNLVVVVNTMNKVERLLKNRHEKTI
jgi:tetratricopeptide (TPR) repeat protein